MTLPRFHVPPRETPRVGSTAGPAQLPRALPARRPEACASNAPRTWAWGCQSPQPQLQGQRRFQAEQGSADSPAQATRRPPPRPDPDARLREPTSALKGASSTLAASASGTGFFKVCKNKAAFLLRSA